MLSPISETDSNKYATLDSYGQTIRRVNPNEERKLTGTGTYDLDNIPQTLYNGPAVVVQDGEDDDDNYSDDEFESYDEEEDDGSESFSAQ